MAMIQKTGLVASLVYLPMEGGDNEKVEKGSSISFLWKCLPANSEKEWNWVNAKSFTNRPGILSFNTSDEL